MLKTLLKLVVGSGLLLSVAISVEAQNPLLLTGRTTKVQVTEDKENVVLTVSLDLTIKNESQSNVILFAHEFQIVGQYIYQSADPTKPNLLFRQSSSPSVNRSTHWTDLQSQLNTSSPPANLTRTLRSGESINFTRTTTMSIYKKGSYPASWSEIQASSSVWLRVVLDMFPSNLDRTSVSQKSYGKRIQKRWSAFGALQIDVLQSAPIKLDLTTNALASGFR